MDQPEIKFLPVDRRKKSSTYVRDCGYNKASQHGEDGIIEKIFEIVGVENKWCVEFGAGDGKSLSNSHTLINELGWSAVLLEPSPSAQRLQDLYKDRDDVHTLSTKVGLGKDDCLDAILDGLDCGIPQEFDFISIDIDGNDYHIWSDIVKYKPRVVCIEFNHMMPNDVYFVQQRDENINIGTSCLAMIELGKQKGYEFVAVSEANAFFVRQALFPLFEIEDNSIDAMVFIGERETKLIQAYNGELFVVGLNVNPWKGFGLDHEMLQVLPKNMREWKFDGKIFPQTKIK